MSHTEAQALANVRGYASAGRVRFSKHAWLRMYERNATEMDVLHALATAQSCRAAPEERWRVEGKDRDGDDLTVVVVLENGVLVVTLF